ncbi:MAG: ABC transporter permease [Chloroflexi bacterium]|nr:ABC transporter permease [Chloroflexota bacterium]
MAAYIVRRLIQGVVILIIISFVGFMLTRLSGDPLAQYTNNPRISAADRARIARELGVDRPLPIQYLGWLSKAVRLDFGYSFTTREPVMKRIAERLPNTLILMITSEIVIIIISLLVGVYQATHQYSILDNLLTALSFVGYSMPIFFIAMGLILIFAVWFKELNVKQGLTWLPYLPTGANIWDQSKIENWIRQLILPVASLTIIQVAGYTRYIRSSMLEVLSQDYVRTARAKGLDERMVILRHAFKNSALPFVTIIGLDIPFLLGGAIVTETVFSWPGMGRLFWEQAGRGDFPVVMGILILVAVAVVIFQILTDVVYTMLDPRIRLS